MSQLININILIADRNFRLKIEPANEAYIRQISVKINQKITEFKQLYAGKDIQDYLSMVILWFLSEKAVTGQTDLDFELISQKIISIEKLFE